MGCPNSFLFVFCCRFLRLSQLPWLPVQRTRSIMRRPGSVWRSWLSTSNLSATPEVLKTHACYFYSLFYFIINCWLSCCFWKKLWRLLQHGKSSAEYCLHSHFISCESTGARWLLMDMALFPFQRWCMSLCILHVSVVLGTEKKVEKPKIDIDIPTFLKC